MVRSEEELTIVKLPRVTGRVRLRKRIVTAPVSLAITLRRDEVRLRREPLGGPDAPVAHPALFREQVHDLVLEVEEPVVRRELVPRERVRLVRDAVTEERVVRDELRREVIDLETEDYRRR